MVPFQSIRMVLFGQIKLREFGVLICMKMDKSEPGTVTPFYMSLLYLCLNKYNFSFCQSLHFTGWSYSTRAIIRWAALPKPCQSPGIPRLWYFITELFSLNKFSHPSPKLEYPVGVELVVMSYSWKYLVLKFPCNVLSPLNSLAWFCTTVCLRNEVLEKQQFGRRNSVSLCGLHTVT